MREALGGAGTFMSLPPENSCGFISLGTILSINAITAVVLASFGVNFCLIQISKRVVSP